MQLASQSGESDQKMSPSIYAALIDSLFTDPGPMFAGALCAAVAAVMTVLKTGNAWLWPCVALLIVTGALRALDTRQYQRLRGSLSPDDVARWEVRYQFGAMLYAAALGLWCLVVVMGSDDAVAHMIATSVTLCYVAAGGGRTYGRPWIFHVQMLLACGPLTAALALHGSPYYIGMALLNVLFFVALKHISTSLQKIFVRALIAREREAALASQFDTALNNMPHGLSMFRADGRLAVMNHRFSEMMNLSDDFVQRGASVSDICSACVVTGAISATSAKLILREVESSEPGDITTTDPDFSKNRALSWTFQPMVGGGTVVLVEDITQRKDAEARISHLARYDELTELTTGSISATKSGACWRSRRAPSSFRRCCSSISTSSSRSTTRWAIPAATSCCARSPTACARCCGPRISWRGSAATNLSCSSRTSSRRRMRRALPGASSTG